MANRLKKLAQVSYTPGVVGQAGRSAYCAMEPYWVNGYYPVATAWMWVPDQPGVYPQHPEGGYWLMLYANYGSYVPGYYAYRRVCYPAVPYIPAIPAVTTYTSITGWNGGARSYDQINRDGYAEFQVSDGSFGVSVGISATNVSQLPSEPTHSFYVTGTTASVVESGITRVTLPAAHAYATKYRITRRGRTVTYTAGAWSYTSLVSSDGAVFVDAAMYASGSFVDNPVIVNLDPTGQATGTLSALWGAAYGRNATTEHTGYTWSTSLSGNPGTDKVAANSATAASVTELRLIGNLAPSPVPLVAGDILRINDDWYTVTGPAVDNGSHWSIPVVYSGGDNALPADNESLTIYVDRVGAASTAKGGYASAAGSLAALRGEAGTTFVVRAAGSLAAMTGVAADRPYSYGGGKLPALYGTADGGYPDIFIATMTGGLGSLVGGATGLTGEVGGVAATLGALGGWASQGAYGEARGALPAMTGYADAGWPVANEAFQNEPLILGDQYFPSASTAAAFYTDGLDLSDQFIGFLMAEDVIYDALNLSDTTTVTQALEAMITSSLAAGNELTGAVRVVLPGGVVPGEPLQYAVNAITGAVTTYTGFGFDAYARSNQRLYGCKPDGVYRVRRGDDDGVPIQGYVDFGGTDYGSTSNKTVEFVYLGVDTDGTVFARVSTDGVDRTYRVVQRGTVSRAVTARGVSGRVWGISLDIVDATDFDMDMMEVRIGLSTGRWRSR